MLTCFLYNMLVQCVLLVTAAYNIVCHIVVNLQKTREQKPIYLYFENIHWEVNYKSNFWVKKCLKILKPKTFFLTEFVD